MLGRRSTRSATCDRMVTRRCRGPCIRHRMERRCRCQRPTWRPIWLPHEGPTRRRQIDLVPGRPQPTKGHILRPPDRRCRVPHATALRQGRRNARQKATGPRRRRTQSAWHRHTSQRTTREGRMARRRRRQRDTEYRPWAPRQVGRRRSRWLEVRCRRRGHRQRRRCPTTPRAQEHTLLGRALQHRSRSCSCSSSTPRQRHRRTRRQPLSKRPPQRLHRTAVTRCFSKTSLRSSLRGISPRPSVRFRRGGWNRSI
mmetsp:Transcript_89522/g.252215  ORF Transcript_89522/g.252215 Transcript_89522/m.252215 type:complete len:255 (+) Transcript_89522:634-1398(+)